MTDRFGAKITEKRPHICGIILNKSQERSPQA